jgi:flagellar motor switch protein FliN/FliY
LDNLPEFLLGQFVMVAFKMEIGDLINSEIMQLYPIEFAKELLQLFTIDSSESESAPEPAPSPTPAPAPEPAPQPMQGMAPQQGMDMSAGQGMPMQGMPMQGMPYGYPPQGMPMQGMPYGYPPQGMPMQGMPYGYPPQQDINVSQASFQPFVGDVGGMSKRENIDLIMDVPLEVTVELGRTSKSIKDILEFAPGTIVELNKIAGEAIDVLVNGKYVAKGEVVVIEESFGVRITEIIKD